MASAKTIGRLYADVKNVNLTDSIKPQAEQVKTANLSDSLLDREPSMFTRTTGGLAPSRGRFGAPAIMGAMHPSAPVDRGGHLRAMAAQGRMRTFVRRQARRHLI